MGGAEEEKNRNTVTDRLRHPLQSGKWGKNEKEENVLTLWRKRRKKIKMGGGGGGNKSR